MNGAVRTWGRMILPGLMLVSGANLEAKGRKRMTHEQIIQQVLDATQPLKYPRGRRLPLYVWALRGAPSRDDAATVKLLKALDARGMALLAVWNTGKNRDASLKEALRIARLQKQLGLSVGVDAVRPLYAFFNGDPKTAHVDTNGKPFFDESFHSKHKIGCPFAVDSRFPVIRGQVEFFADAYAKAGIPIDYVFSDWEIDGPIEWNGGWDAARRCVRCRKYIPDIDDFRVFQSAYRRIRSRMQKECYAQPILNRFPDALVGNYGVYPCDGWRYWYDWFEDFNPKLPHRFDGREPVRPWRREFPDTGYTFAMPVVYTWSRIFGWYDFRNTDYRWFYNMLKVASNAGANTPASVPIISFVHHLVIYERGKSDANEITPMSDWAYKELLWHALLRGHDDFFLWCPNDQVVAEIEPLHEVWAASLAYNDFILRGTPVVFDVPRTEGPVVSGLRLGDRVLVRRTDFGTGKEPAFIRVDGHRYPAPPHPGRCWVLSLDR